MIKNIYSKSSYSDNQSTFLLSWKDINKKVNYNFYKKKILIDNLKKKREKFIVNYLKNVPVNVSTNNQIDSSFPISWK